LTPFSSWPGTPVSRTGDRDDPLTTRRNRSSSIAETYPVGKVRPTQMSASRRAIARRSSDPLVGGLRRRARIRGPKAAWTQHDGSRTSLRAVTMTARLGPEGHLGVLPELFNS